MPERAPSAEAWVMVTFAPRASPKNRIPYRSVMSKRTIIANSTNSAPSSSFCRRCSQVDHFVGPNVGPPLVFSAVRGLFVCTDPSLRDCGLRTADRIWAIWPICARARDAPEENGPKGLCTSSPVPLTLKSKGTGRQFADHEHAIDLELATAHGGEYCVKEGDS